MHDLLMTLWVKHVPFHYVIVRLLKLTSKQGNPENVPINECYKAKQCFLQTSETIMFLPAEQCFAA